MELRLRKLENDFIEQKNKEEMVPEKQASRLSKLEKQLKAQEVKLLAIETKQELQFNKITQDFSSLKRGVFKNKSQNKRAAEEINKNSKMFRQQPLMHIFLSRSPGCQGSR